MPDAHSKYSASGFEAATLCPGKRVMEAGKPDSSSKYADEGTAAHSYLSDSIEAVGKPVYVVNGKTWPVTDDMHKAVHTALANIREIVGDGMLLSEVQVCYATYLGVPAEEGWGTSDIVALRGPELQVHDYKHGMGVEVEADDNPQMKLYALGALAVLREMGEEPTTVRLVIHQPRIKQAPSEWTCTVAELEAWGHGAARSSVCTQINAERIAAQGSDAQAEWEATFLRPNDKSCKFCRAKATCPALRAAAAETVFGTVPAAPDDFVMVLPKAKPTATTQATGPAEGAWLSAVMDRADLIEDWLAAVRAEVHRRLTAGDKVPGYKLVTGKRGNRAWADAEAATAQLKAARLKHDQMYAYTLISPTKAEELTKGETPAIGPRQWPKLKALITQSEGKPSVAPLSDKRQALEFAPVASEFNTVSQPATEESYA
jgi:hypothetical protein